MKTSGQNCLPLGTMLVYGSKRSKRKRRKRERENKKVTKSQCLRQQSVTNQGTQPERHTARKGHSPRVGHKPEVINLDTYKTHFFVI
jgi:hypothetical protein